jgi:hypothetical protein
VTRPEITGRKLGAEDAEEGAGKIGDEESEASSIATFCRRHGISIATYYNLKSTGQAPEEAVVRGRRLITKEAAAAWRRARTALAT